MVRHIYSDFVLSSTIIFVCGNSKHSIKAVNLHCVTLINYSVIALSHCNISRFKSISVDYTFKIYIRKLLSKYFFPYRYRSALMIEAQQKLVLYYMDSLMRKLVHAHTMATCGGVLSLLWYSYYVLCRRMVFKSDKERQKGAELIKKEAKDISSFFARLSHATNPKVL